MDLVTFKVSFDQHLGEWIQNKIYDAQQIVKNPRLELILSHIHTLMFAGGKRIRPYCVYLGYTLYGGQHDAAIMRYAKLFEVLHTMALVHDDVMDEAQKRHNVETVHHFVQETLHTQARRISDGQAILVGDLLLSWVYELLHEDYDFGDIKLQTSQHTVHTMIQEVILGQMMDLDLSTSGLGTKEDLERKNLYKTARYSFVRPLVAGAQLAGANTQQLDLLTEIGENLGLAYQMRDDLLDILELENDKTTFHDIQEGQQTLLTYYIQQHASRDQQELLTKCMGTVLDAHKVQELKHMFMESGAIDYAKQTITDHIKKAQNTLHELGLETKNAQNYLEQLMQRMLIV